MTVAIRKEQVLCLLVLGIGWLVWNGLGGASGGGRASPKQLDHTPAPVPATALAGAPGAGFARAEILAEPRETRGLPPRDLEFPEPPPLSVAALPLDPGPDFAHALALREDGRIVEGVALAGAGPPAAPPSPEPAGGGQEPAAGRAALGRTYDRLYLQGLSEPFYGFVEVDGMDPFDAESLKSFEGRVVRFRRYREKEQRLEPQSVFENVREIKLAATLRNEVARAARAVPADAAHLDQRAQLIAWLLGKAREAAWVYDEALAQAELYTQTSGGNLEGLRWQVRVLRARGDLAGEHQLLAGIVGEHRETAFRYEGLGRVLFQLGLHADAERDLLRAVELGRNDPRPHGALAAFLLARGRSRDALRHAARAEQTLGGLIDPGERAQVVRTIVACHLAVADFAAARTALEPSSDDGSRAYLQGCVAYAAGELPAALAAFRQAASGPDGPAALLGQGAVLLRQQDWQGALDAFAAVADQAPLLRHRALCGTGLLHLRLGQFDQATAALDRALECNPLDPYAHYLRGRVLRLQGQVAGAVEALAGALRLQDDFVHAVAEMAAAHSRRARDARGDDAATATLWATRYGDRAAAMAHAPSVELYYWQGLYRFAAGNPRGAEASFVRARETAQQEAERGRANGAIAVVQYSRGLVDDAVTVLQKFAELPKDDPMRVWAAARVAEIDDHAQKEMLEDRFERVELGGTWSVEREEGFGVGGALAGNRLTFRGRVSSSGEVRAVRTGAVQQGRNFLAVGCALQLAGGSLRAGFAGLRIEMQRDRSGRPDLQVQVGVRDGRPRLTVIDNREESQGFDPAIDGFDAAAVQQLELRAVPRGDQQARRCWLQVRWNGALVHEQELKSLGGGTGGELRTVLFAQGSRGVEADVTFDDYRLERRKER